MSNNSIEPKLGKDSFFDYEKTTKDHYFELGFQILNKQKPDSNAEESIPPIEHYEKIAMNYDDKNNQELEKSLDNFATYLYKNGLDDVEEFNQSRMEEILVSLCEFRNTQLSQTAFHIITLLQSKGPSFPEFCLNTDFFDFCYLFLQKTHSRVLYYSLAAIVNLSYQSDSLRDYIFERIPLENINSFFHHYDANVKEVSLDLACAYLKCPLSPENVLAILNLAKEALVSKTAYSVKKLFHRPGFWILDIILRNYPELTNEILVENVLESVNEIFEDEDEGSIIPGLIFISYAYEFNYEIPDLDYNGILDVFASPPTYICQRHALRTIDKIITRNPDKIAKFIQHGIIIQTKDALDNAKYVDKISIGLWICNVLLYDINNTCDRILQTKSISFFLDLIEYDDTELNKLALTCLVRIFDIADLAGGVQEIMGRFDSSDGYATICNLEHDEDDETSSMAKEFIERYYSEREQNTDDESN